MPRHDGSLAPNHANGYQQFLDYPNHCRLFIAPADDLKYLDKTSGDKGFDWGGPTDMRGRYRSDDLALLVEAGNDPKRKVLLDSRPWEGLQLVAIDPDAPGTVEKCAKWLNGRLIINGTGGGGDQYHGFLSQDFINRCPTDWRVPNSGILKPCTELGGGVQILANRQFRVLPGTKYKEFEVKVPGANGEYAWRKVTPLTIDDPDLCAFLQSYWPATDAAPANNSAGNGKIAPGEGQHNAIRDYSYAKAHEIFNREELLANVTNYANRKLEGGAAGLESRYPGDIATLVDGAMTLVGSGAMASPANLPRVQAAPYPLTDPAALAKVNAEYAVDDAGNIVFLETGDVIAEDKLALKLGDRGLADAWAYGNPERLVISHKRILQPGAGRVVNVATRNKSTGLIEQIPTLNLWRGFGVDPIDHGPEVSSLIWTLLDHLLGNTEPKIRRLFWQHQFGPVLFLGAKVRWAPFIFSAEEGVGKTMWTDIMRFLWGEHGLQWGDDDIKSPYNGQLAQAIYVVVTEPSPLNARKTEGRLKPYISDLTLNLVDKYQRAWQMANPGNWTFVANYPTAANIDRKTRRLLPIHALEKRRDEKFNQELGDLVGIDAQHIASQQLLYDLLNKDHLFFPISPERRAAEAPMLEAEADLEPGARQMAVARRLLGRLDRKPPDRLAPAWDPSAQGAEPILHKWNPGAEVQHGAGAAFMIALNADDATSWIREVMASPKVKLEDLYPNGDKQGEPDLRWRADGWLFYMNELHQLMKRDNAKLGGVSRQKLMSICFKEGVFPIPLGGHAKLFGWCLIPPREDMLDLEHYQTDDYNDDHVEWLMKARGWILNWQGEGANPVNAVASASEVAINWRDDIVDLCKKAIEKGVYEQGPTKADVRLLLGKPPKF